MRNLSPGFFPALFKSLGLLHEMNIPRLDMLVNEFLPSPQEPAPFPLMESLVDLNNDAKRLCLHL